MNYEVKLILARFLVALVCTVCASCAQTTEEPQDSTQRQPPVTHAQKLGDIAEPNEDEREVDGIHIIGSGLTDEHINAIRKLTDDRKPANPSEYLVRAIEHTGKNTATHVWQTRHLQSYQKLEFEKGEWQVVETGGGFGRW